mgnify:CR=1 FL=1
MFLPKVSTPIGTSGEPEGGGEPWRLEQAPGPFFSDPGLFESYAEWLEAERKNKKGIGEEKIVLIRKLRDEGLNLEAIHRVVGTDKRTIRKYLSIQNCDDVTLPHCRCKPGIYFIGCPFCDTATKDTGEGGFP